MLLVAADSKVVRKHVKDGLDFFQRNDFSAAAKSFSDADLAMPDNAVIKFNRACAESRIQNREDARRLFRSAAAAKSGNVAKAAHYNLGCLEALEARGEFGEEPADLTKAKRQKGVEHLTTAIGHFRDCLAIDPQNKDARRNIEIIRLWLAEMRKAWKERDADREANPTRELQLANLLSKLDVDQYVSYLTAREHIQGDLESTAAHLQNQQLVLKDLKDVEKAIAIEFDKADPSDPSVSAERKLARDFVTKLRDRAESHATVAMNATIKHEHEEAVPAQIKALDDINEMYAVVADFPHTVRRALRTESALVGLTQAVEGRQRGAYGKSQTMEDGNTFLERETRVAGLANQLVPKAELMLKAMAEQQARQQVQLPIGAGGPQKSGYEKSAELAIELGPRVVELTEQSRDLLADRKVKDAVPLQQEAIELLKKIVEPLPNDENQDQNEDQENDRGNENLDQVSEEDEQNEDEGEGESAQDQNKKDKQQQEQQVRDREHAEPVSYTHLTLPTILLV